MKCFSLILAAVFFMGASPECMKPVTQNGDRSNYYLALRSSDLTKINTELSSLKAKPGSQTSAFEGALLMRKSGLLKNASEKLDLFKSGRVKLEGALEKEGNNTELHFLRLIVQENAPKMLHYDGNITEDASFISSQFREQDHLLRQEILNYSKTSAALKTIELHE